MDQLAKGEFDGYLIFAVNKLRPKLPLPLPDFEDLLQQMRVWAIEAVELYVPSEAAFTTFLYKHLSIRSMQWFNYCWMPCNQPRERWVLSFSVFDKDSDGESGFDPEDLHSKTDFHTKIESTLGELKPYNKDLFRYFVDYVEWEDKYCKTSKLLPAFKLPPPAYHVSAVTGVAVHRVIDFLDDVERVGLCLSEML